MPELTTREKVEALARQGLSMKEVAERLDMPKSTVHRNYPGDHYTHAPKRGSLSPEAWKAFLTFHTRWEETHPRGPTTRYVNGTVLDDYRMRSVRRWEIEGSHATFWGADEFCQHVGLHIDDYLMFCWDRGLWPWARDEAPEWELS